MKEIKFRQWDYRNKIWHYFDFKDGCVQGVINASLSLYPIYQFTGLHDKNGQEIYEGDMLKCGNYILVCEWDNERAEFRFRISNKLATGFHSTYIKQTEVIGNIHENPELLNNA